MCRHGEKSRRETKKDMWKKNQRKYVIHTLQTPTASATHTYDWEDPLIALLSQGACVFPDPPTHKQTQTINEYQLGHVEGLILYSRMGGDIDRQADRRSRNDALNIVLRM